MVWPLVRCQRMTLAQGACFHPSLALWQPVLQLMLLPFKSWANWRRERRFCGHGWAVVFFPQACSRMAFQRRWRRITRAHATCQGLLSGSAWHERHSFSRQETLDMQRWVQQYVNKLGAPIHRLLNVVDISITLSKLNHTLIYKHPQAHRKYQNSIQEAPNGITHTYIHIYPYTCKRFISLQHHLHRI